MAFFDEERGDVGNVLVDCDRADGNAGIVWCCVMTLTVAGAAEVGCKTEKDILARNVRR
jgi:hypothetical protein